MQHSGCVKLHQKFPDFVGLPMGLLREKSQKTCMNTGLFGSRSGETGFNATRLGVAAYLVPYMFVLNPVLVFVRPDGVGTGLFFLIVVKAIITAVIGMMGLATGFTGYLRTNCKVWERIVLVVSGLMLVDAGTVTDLIGIALFVMIAFVQTTRIKPRAAV